MGDRGAAVAEVDVREAPFSPSLALPLPSGVGGGVSRQSLHCAFLYLPQQVATHGQPTLLIILC